MPFGLSESTSSEVEHAWKPQAKMREMNLQETTYVGAALRFFHSRSSDRHSECDSPAPAWKVVSFLARKRGRRARTETSKIARKSLQSRLAPVGCFDAPRKLMLANGLRPDTGPPSQCVARTRTLFMQTTFEVRSCPVAPPSTPGYLLVWPQGEGLC